MTWLNITMRKVWTQVGPKIFTHILELFVSTIVRDLLSQVYQDVVACVVRRPQQLLHLPPPLFVSHLVILQHSQHLICSSTQDISWLSGEKEQQFMMWYINPLSTVDIQ